MTDAPWRIRAPRVLALGWLLTATAPFHRLRLVTRDAGEFEDYWLEVVDL